MFFNLSSTALEMNTRSQGFAIKSKDHRWRLELSSSVLETCLRLCGRNSVLASVQARLICFNLLNVVIYFTDFAYFGFLCSVLEFVYDTELNGKSSTTAFGFPWWFADRVSVYVYSVFHNCKHNILHHSAPTALHGVLP